MRFKKHMMLCLRTKQNKNLFKMEIYGQLVELAVYFYVFLSEMV